MSATPTAADVARAKGFVDLHWIADVERKPFPDFMNGEDGPTLRTSDWIAQLIADVREETRAEAVAHERERAARACEQQGGPNPVTERHPHASLDDVDLWDEAVMVCAAAIRAGEGA